MIILRRSLLLTFIPALVSLAQTSVRAWEEPLVIPTYKVEAPEPNPMFYAGRAYQGAKGPIYPYPLIDRLTDVRENRTYNAVYLENDFVKLCVLPEIGGRIFYAIDKTNGYDFVYHQHVIKPALIGMLGAWISGGVEWNIPHHHRASTFMTVDHALVENPDGSKTIWIGEIELRHRMKWIVGLTLYPGRSYIEVTVKLFNRTPIAHSILYFSNVAVHANAQYQVIFPPSTELATYHGKNQFTRWPIGDGVFAGTDYKGLDLSWWKSHPSPISFFAWNYQDDFLGGYDHGKRAGIALVADHHTVPGKKFFEWGNGSQGEMWDKILTDSDGPYLELMVGGYSDNQPDYSWCQPYEVKTLKQYWYPIRQIGGLKNANQDAALNLEITSPKTSRIGFNTTAAYRNAKVSLQAGDKVIFDQTIDVSPTNPYSKEVTLPPGIKEEDLRLALSSAEGNELIAYGPVKKREPSSMPEPVKPPPPPKEIGTNEELYLTGLRLEQFYNPAFGPYPYYEEALRRDPGDYRANTALGILYLKRGMFKEAEEKLHRAVDRAARNYTSPKDGEALYYLGVALRAQGKLDAACDALYKATWSQAWHAAAYHVLAELECQKGDFAKALEFIERSISTNALNTKAQCLKAGVLRKLARHEEAERAASGVLASDPLDLWAGNELYLAKAGRKAASDASKELDAIKKKMRNAAHSYLELAVDYSNSGLWDEAIEVLSRLVENARLSVANPLERYYLGYFWEKKGEQDKALKQYKLASTMPTDFCFPFQLESIDVLRSASKMNPGDARAPYYLGNLFYDLQPENAIREWERSRSLDSSFSIIHRNLGLAYARIRNDVNKAIASLERAVACKPNDPRLYLELDQMYEAGGVPAEKRLALLEKNHSTVLGYDDALAREIVLYVQLGRYDQAIDLLENHHFHIWEGGGMIHDVYVDAHLLRGQERFKAKKYREASKDFEAALEYPNNLEVGKPHRDARASQVNYFIGTAHEALGRPEQARRCFEKSVAEQYGWSEIRYYQGLACRKLDREREAIEVFDGLIKFGRERLAASAGLDFFEKFGERQSEVSRLAHAHYLLALGHLGKWSKAEAKAEFEQVLKLNPNHIGAKARLAEIKP
jgi:tetratricopeptide (TPR) repeat protein